MDKPIYTGFVEFVKATFNKSPEELPAEQLLQIKMAFFGGAVVTENLICNEIIAGTEASSAKIIFIIQNELVDFGQDFNIANSGK